jgi:hypothetical protein
MAKKTRGRKPQLETLWRVVQVSSFSASVRIHAVSPRGEEPYIESRSWLELRGLLEEPIRNTKEVRISMYSEEKIQVGTARPASVGAVTQMRPEISIVLSWPHHDFGRVWELALGGLLKFAHLLMTKPHYNTALVVSASFSNEREE